MQIVLYALLVLCGGMCYGADECVDVGDLVPSNFSWGRRILPARVFTPQQLAQRVGPVVQPAPALPPIVPHQIALGKGSEQKKELRWMSLMIATEENKRMRDNYSIR